MGGFISGMGSVMGQMHENQVQRLELQKASLGELAQHAGDQMLNPEAKSQLYALSGMIKTLPPGKKLDDAFKQYGEIMSNIHTANGGGKQNVTTPMNNPTPPPSGVKPMPAPNPSPGSNQAALAPMLQMPVNQQAMASPPPGIPNFDPNGPSPSSSAAQPASSPIAAGATGPIGGGMSSSNAPFRGTDSQSMGATADGTSTGDQTSGQAGIQSVQPVQPSGPIDARQPIRDIFTKYENERRMLGPADEYMISTLAGLQQPYVGQQAANQGTLQKELQEIHQVAPERLKFIQPYLDKVQEDPSMSNWMQLQTVMSAMGSSGGGGMSMNPLMAATFAAPKTERYDAGTLTPEQKAIYQIPQGSTGLWSVDIDRFGRVVRSAPGYTAPIQGFLSNGQKVVEDPHTALANGGTVSANGQPVINPAFVPMTVQQNHQVIHDVNGQPTVENLHSASSRSRGSGILPGPTTIPPASSGGGTQPAPARGGTPTVPPVGGGTGGRLQNGQTLGDSNSLMKMRAEGDLTPEAKKVMMTTTPVMEMMERVKQALMPFKDSDKPASFFFDRLSYAVGMDGNYGKMLSALELGRITQAASVIKGTSRAGDILKAAMIHTPDAWKDSPKLMIDKLETIEENIRAIQDAAQGPYGQRYPGGLPPRAGSSTVPPIKGDGGSTGGSTKRHLVTDGKGNFLEWNGSAWAPAQP